MTVVDVFVPLWPIPILGAVGLREGWKWGLPTVAIRKVQIPDMTEEVVKRGNPADAMGYFRPDILRDPFKRVWSGLPGTGGRGRVR